MRKISIIVPVYNTEKYLKRCIKSILKQTFKDFELLLINDGSTDESGKICDEFALEDERIKVFHQENRGVSSARNIGLEKACGEWIGFVDSDDFCDNDMFEKMYNKTKLHEVDVVVCGYRKVYGNETNEVFRKTESDMNIVNSKVATKSIFTKYQIPSFPCNKLYKANIIRKNNILFDKNVSFGEDLLFLYEFLKISHEVAITEDVFYNYFENKNSTVFDKNPKKRVSGLKVYKKILKETKELDTLKAVRENLLNYRTSLAIFCKFKSANRQKKYSRILKKEVFKKLLETLSSDNLTLKQKIINVSIFFPNLLLFVLKIKG